MNMKAVRISALFNSINQSNPMFVADLRGDSSFQSCRIRGSTLLSTDDCLDEDIFLQAMTKISKMNNFSILFVVDGTVREDVLLKVITDLTSRVQQAKEYDENEGKGVEMKTDDLRSRWKKVISVEHVNFDEFRQSFPYCASLYLGSDFPGQSEKRPPKVYPTVIIPDFMYLGNYYDAADEVKMNDLRMTHIVDATCAYLSRDNANKLSIAYLPIQVWDMEGVDIFQYFETVLQFINDAKSRVNGRILIHCRAGISRSATFVLAYLLHSRTCPSLKAALELVVPERPYVLPNKSFRAQLMDYEESLFGTRSFEDDNAFLSHVSSMNFCWSGIFALETDHDKIPIIAASQRINNAMYREEYPPADTAESMQKQAAKPKKPFLKRGEGKNTANLKIKTASSASATSVTTDAGGGGVGGAGARVGAGADAQLERAEEVETENSATEVAV